MIYNIAHIVSGITNRFSKRISLSLIENSLRFNIRIYSFVGLRTEKDNFLTMLNTLLALTDRFEINGLIFQYNTISACPAEWIQKFRSIIQLPVITIGHGQIHNIPSFDSECPAAMNELIGHLKTQHSKKKFGFYNQFGRPDPLIHARLNSYKGALKKHKLPFSAARVFNGSLKGLISRKNLSCDALICYNDFAAARAISYISEHGFQCPEHIAVTGIDDEYTAVFGRVPLTTIRHDIENLSCTVLEAMKTALSGEKITSRALYGAKVLYRTSCGCAILHNRLEADFLHLKKSAAFLSIDNILSQRHGLESELTDIEENFFSSLLAWLNNIPQIHMLSILEFDEPFNSGQKKLISEHGHSCKLLLHYKGNKEISDNTSNKLFRTADSPQVRSEIVFSLHRTSKYSTITLPLSAEGSIFGLLLLQFKTPDYIGIASELSKIILSHLIPIRFRQAINTYNSRLIESNKQLMFETEHDALTGVYNRKFITESIQKEIDMQRPFALIMLDLDNFKLINDLYGHKSGDELLVLVAKKIAHQLKQSDSVARTGGDEFIILLRNIRAKTQILRVARRILQRIRSEMDSNFSVIKASIGISRYPADGSLFDDILTKADAAMYESKRLGKNTITIFDKILQHRIYTSIMLEKDLPRALRKNEFFLEYQPQYSLDLSLIGAEALLRWKHPERGILYPVDFIKVLENSKFLVESGFQLLEEICAIISRLDKISMPLKISANICPLQFKYTKFIKRLKEIIAASGINPQQLGIEITEGSILSNHTVTRDLYDLGIRLAIDDFGTGYSSLKRLIDFPLCTLKVDKSLIDYVGLDLINEQNIQPKTIVDSRLLIGIILEIAAPLNCPVCFEGVENQVQIDFIREFKYENTQFQGYLLSKPVSKDAFLEIARKEKKGSGLTR